MKEKPDTEPVKYRRNAVVKWDGQTFRRDDVVTDPGACSVMERDWVMGFVTEMLTSRRTNAATRFEILLETPGPVA